MPKLDEQETSALRELSRARVAIVGDVMLDEFVYGDSTRLSPEAPVPVVTVQQDLDCLGGAANVARNVRDLGAEPILIGVVGSDSTADRVRHALEDAQISANYLAVDAGRKTGIKTRVIARGQQLVRIDHESTDHIQGQTADAMLQSFKTVVQDCTAVIFSDYGKGVLGPELFPKLKDLVPETVFTCVDPFPDHAQAYAGVDAITPNHDEACKMWTGDPAVYEAGEQLAKGLRQQLDVREIYVTLGKLGMAYAGVENSFMAHVSKMRQVFDVSGAGDTVIAVVAALRGLGIAPEIVCKVANRAAGLVVEKIGTATVSQAEILDDGQEPTLF